MIDERRKKDDKEEMEMVSLKMEKSLWKKLLLWCVCIGFFALAPKMTVWAAEEPIIGGMTWQNATEINSNVEYIVDTSDNEKKWFKVKAPAYEQVYVGVGYGSLASVEAYGEGYCNEEATAYGYWNELEGEVSGNYGITLGEETTYWSRGEYRKGGVLGQELLKGDRYYYFVVTSELADSVQFKVLFTEQLSSKLRPIALNQNYQITSYTTTYYGVRYQFTASKTGQYKAIISTANANCIVSIYYKNNNRCITRDEYCEEGKTKELVFNVIGGVTYYIDLCGKGTLKDKTKPAIVTARISDKTVSAINLNATEVTLNKGEQFFLTAATQPLDAVDGSVSYASDNPQVASVTPDGQISAVKGGKTTIRVTANDGSGTQSVVAVTVRPKLVERLALNYSNLQMDILEQENEGTEYALQATVYPADADNIGVAYTSSNPQVVNVEKSTGVLEPRKAGTAVITCISADGSGKFAKCIVTVKESHQSGYKKTIGDFKYQVTTDTYGGGSIKVQGVKNRAKKIYIVPDTVEIDGYTYKVEEIGNQAFKNCKKATSITLGKNIKIIGNKSFYNCSKLKTMKFNGKRLKKVGKDAFKNIGAKTKIRVPISSVSKYKKLMVGKGQKKTVKIVRL